MPTQLENLVQLFATYSEDKYMHLNLEHVAKSFNLTVEELDGKVVAARTKAATKIEDRVFRVSEARNEHAKNLEALKNAKPEGRALMLRAAAHFGGRAFGARLLNGTEESLRAAVRECAIASGMTEEEVQTITEDWSAGVTLPLKAHAWRDKFHTGSELDSGEVVMHVERILPEGIVAIGSLSAVGKTWFALSLARALTTGTAFMGVFRVPVAVPVLYLCPEMGGRAVRKRLEKLRVPMSDMFFCQTVSDGVVKLSDPSLESAVAELRPIIFLDTAVRFSRSDDENSARENAQSLAADMFEFRRWGARAIACLHHAPKYSGDAEAMTLENILRGTGDLGAMCDAVWGLQHDRQMKGKKWDVAYLQESQALTRVFVKCVKARDFEAAPPFRITGRPYLDSKGDFAVATEFDTRSVEERVLEAIEQEPTVSAMALKERFGVGFDTVVKIANKGGFKQKGVWEQTIF